LEYTHTVDDLKREPGHPETWDWHALLDVDGIIEEVSCVDVIPIDTPDEHLGIGELNEDE